MIKHLLRFTLSILFLNSVSAFAEAGMNGSEFLHQADAHKFEVAPKLGLGLEVVKFSANDEKSEDAQIPLTVGLQYGLNEMFAVGLEVGYAAYFSRMTCAVHPCFNSSRQAKGLLDPKLSFKGRNGLPVGTVRYGADISLSIEKHKTSDSSDHNQASGGHTIAIWAGYELPIGPGILGGRIAVDAMKGDRQQQDTLSGVTTDSKLTGGNKLAASVFYELPTGTFTYGASITHTMREESRTVVSGTPSASNRDQGSDTELTAYVPMDFSTRFTLIPSAHLRDSKYSKSMTVDNARFYGVDCAARFTF